MLYLLKSLMENEILILNYNIKPVIDFILMTLIQQPIKT